MGRSVALDRLPATQDEFEAWCSGPGGPECGRWEFLYGHVVGEPPASWPHGSVGGRFASRLGSWVLERGLGQFFDASQGFALPSGDTVEPDAAVVLTATWQAAPPPVHGRFLRVVPDLVAEILSPGTARHDLGPKRHVYERNGVREYWVLDPRARRITVLVLGGGGRFAPMPPASSERPARSLLLPGFALGPADVFP